MKAQNPRRSAPASVSLGVATAIGCFVAAVSLVIIAGGFFFDVGPLREVIPGSVPIAGSTVLALLGIGVGIAAIATRQRGWVAVIAASFSLLVTLTSGAEEIGAGPLSEQMLTTISGDAFQGVPSLKSSLSVCLIAVAIILIAVDRAVLSAQVIAALAGLVGYMAILGVAMTPDLASREDAWWVQLPIAVAFLVALSAAGVVLSRPDCGYAATVNSPQSGGRAARILIPVIFTIGVVAALAVRVMVDRGVEFPIPAQIVTGCFVLLMAIATLAVARKTNTAELAGHRRTVIATAVDSAMEGVLVVGQDGMIEEVNQTICEMTGYRREQLIGRGLEMLVPEKYRARHVIDRGEFWQKRKSRPMGTSAETAILDAYGNETPVEISLAFMELGSGATAVVATVRDRSEVMRALRSLEEFAYVVSHDLRAPLRSVIGFTDLLRTSFEPNTLDEDQEDYLAEITDGATRMNSLIEALLSYSQLAEAADEKMNTDVDVELDRVLADFDSALADVQGEVVRSGGAQLKWNVNQPLMDSALANLISNSIKYRSPKRNLRIEISATESARNTVVVVRDNGRGIPPDQLGRAKRIFQRLTSDGQGLGIGLASVERIVEVHDGTLTLTSDGSTYTEARISIPTSPNRS